MKRTSHSLKIIKSAIAATLAVIIMGGLSVRSAQGGYLVTLQEVGSDVVATGSGILDTTLLAINVNPTFAPGLVQPNAAAINTGPTGFTSNAALLGNLVSGPTNFGSGGQTLASSGSGDTVGFALLPPGQFSLFVPQNCQNRGTCGPLSDTSTYPNASCASLGITPGTYTWTWGSGADQNFTVQVGAAPASQLLNISTRLNVQTGDNVLIGGFIITGTAPKKVILRAIGPSLANANPPVAGALADPILELHEPDGTVITNDNWKTTQEAEIIASTIPPTNDLESAIVATLNPGAYTAVVSGKNGGIGVGLVEAYDLDQAAPSQLANISTRGFVETGDNVMIGGFIVGGNGEGNTSVIVRAIGPSLANANPPVPGSLSDPTLELHDGNGTTIASNDNWRDTQEAEIEATGIPPTDNRESAIVMTLAPGAYTAIVSGKNNTTGVALVEAYNLQ
jgi:hypothetical protein